MTWLTVILGTFAAGALAWIIRDMTYAHVRRVKAIEERHARRMFDITKKQLQASHQVAKGRFRAQLPDESPWDLFADFYRAAGVSPPWEYSYAYMDTSVQTTIKVYVWTACVEGVVHRANMLRHSGVVSYVLRCAPMVMVTTEVDTHLVDACPVITCFHCVARGD